MSASPLSASCVRRRCTGSSERTISNVGQTRPLRKWPPCAVPSALPITTCPCNLGLPSCWTMVARKREHLNLFFDRDFMISLLLPNKKTECDLAESPNSSEMCIGKSVRVCKFQ
jgi:hypothetical protein